MHKKEKKEVTSIQYVTTSVVCDNCGKEHIGSSMPDGWHEFSAYHSAWGNDSVDSGNDYMVCSPECYHEKLKEAVEHYDGYDSSVIDDMNIDFAKRLLAYLNE